MSEGANRSCSPLPNEKDIGEGGDHARLRAEFLAAFGRLKQTKTHSPPDWHLSSAVDRLTLLAASWRSAPRDASFRQTGRKKAQEQISELTAAAEKLVACAHKLQAPAITALVDHAVFRHDVIRFGQELLTRAAAVDLQQIPEKAHRGTEQAVNFSRVVVAGLASDFEIQTGNRPTLRVRDGVAGGPFVEFVGDILGAMSVTVSVKHVCREALEALRKKRKKVGKTTP